MDNHCDGYGLKRFWEIFEIWICLPMPDPNDIGGLSLPAWELYNSQLRPDQATLTAVGVFQGDEYESGVHFELEHYPSSVSLPYFGHYHEKFAVKFHSLLFSLHVVLNDASSAKLLASSYG